MNLFRYVYHTVLYHYYTWKLHQDCNRFRKFARSEGDYTNYTDEDIVLGILYRQTFGDRKYRELYEAVYDQGDQKAYLRAKLDLEEYYTKRGWKRPS